MKIKKNNGIVAAVARAAAVAAMFAYCSCTTRVAGSVTEGGNVEVSGKVLYVNGSPAAHADIVLRTQRFLKDTSGAAAEGTSHTAANTRTDDNGFFRIDSIDTGEYFISATKGDSAALMPCTCFTAVPKVELPSAELRPASTITGTVQLDSNVGCKVYVQVYGLDRLALVDSATGAFDIRQVPPGNVYTLRVVASTTLYSPVSIDNVDCKEGQPYAVDTVALVSFSNENYSQWPYSRRLYLNTTQNGAAVSGTVVNFPVLVRLNADDSAFVQAREDGRDVRFSNASGTHLPFEIEQFDPYGRMSAIWVLVDTVRGNDSTQLTMYWGNKKAPMSSMSAAVFDTANGYVAVWHLNQTGVNTPRLDATENGYNGATERYEGDESRKGLIGFCDSLDGVSDHLRVASIPCKNALTFSAWVSPGYAIDNRYILSKGGTGTWPVYALYFNANKEACMNLSLSGTNYSVSGGAMALNKWSFITGTYDGSRLSLYVDGVLQKQVSATGTIDQSVKNTFMGILDGDPASFLSGKLDEVRMLRSAQSPDWVKLNFENQKESSTLVQFGK
jgi:hypothetical protein